MSSSSSLPFHGGLLDVATFWATFVLWQGSELFLSARRRSRSTGVSQDRGSFRLLAVLLSVAFSVDFACALLLPSVALPSARTVFIVGLCCVLFGTALRSYAVANAFAKSTENSRGTLGWRPAPPRGDRGWIAWPESSIVDRLLGVGKHMTGA